MHLPQYQKGKSPYTSDLLNRGFPIVNQILIYYNKKIRNNTYSFLFLEMFLNQIACLNNKVKVEI